MTCLDLKGVSAAYQDVDIVSKIDLHVGEREIVAVAGTNGAGKSTIIKAIMGLMPRCRGSMTFLGHDLLGHAAEDRVRLGISYVPQVANVFSALTVLENLQVVEGIRDFAGRSAEIFDLFPALASRRRTRASSLSGGERQQLALGRALMSKPKLIVMDEPTAALSPALGSQVFTMVQQLQDIGVAVLLVEQRARQALAISTRGYILDSGSIVMSGPAADLLADTRMADLYLGRA